jgi:hypothetical protein
MDMATTTHQEPTMNASIHFNGKTLTAPTKRAYTHAVVWSDGERTGVRNWCGSIELAEKAARKESSPVAMRGVRMMGVSKHSHVPAVPGQYYIVEVATGSAILYATV